VRRERRVKGVKRVKRGRTRTSTCRIEEEGSLEG
jgi:hypothetical protein